jgi:hypothetical protein
MHACHHAVPVEARALELAHIFGESYGTIHPRGSPTQQGTSTRRPNGDLPSQT